MTPQPTQKKAFAIKNYFGDFEYSLEARMHGGVDPTVDFVLNRRPGYCQYFASGAALLLRSIDIPARVVTGFIIREKISEKSRSWVVRRRDSHAWIEYYDGDSGKWVLMDPTPLAAMNDALGLKEPSSFSKLLDQYRIKLSVMVALFRDFSFSEWFTSTKPKRLIPPLVLAALIALVVIFRRKLIAAIEKIVEKLYGLMRTSMESKKARRGENPLTNLFEQFLAELEKAEIYIQSSETGEEIICRIKRELSGIPELCTRCEEFVNQFNSARYQSTPEGELERASVNLDVILSDIRSDLPN